MSSHGQLCTPGQVSHSKVSATTQHAEAVLAHYLIEEGLKPREVRQIVENLRDEWGEWPLAAAPLEHQGRLVVGRRGGDVAVDVGEHADQEVILGTVDLRRVRDALMHGGWVALRNRREHIEVDPERLSGRPTVRGRRLSTEMVANIAARADGRNILHAEFGLSEEQIDDAVGYERDVRRAIAA